MTELSEKQFKYEINFTTPDDKQHFQLHLKNFGREFIGNRIKISVDDATSLYDIYGIELSPMSFEYELDDYVEKSPFEVKIEYISSTLVILINIMVIMLIIIGILFSF